MATTDDFAGRNCPLCGAIDSLETDTDRGEVACTECAKVVAMGLEESVFTRFNDGATYEEADKRGGGFGDSEEARLLAQADGGGMSGLSRSAAAALAAGHAVRGGGGAQADISTEAGREARFKGAVLHSKMRSMIENLTRISRRAAGVTNAAGENPIKAKALSIARTFVGYRRSVAKKVEHQNEVAAACFQIASEIFDEPVPLAELRVLDPSLKNVEAVRREVIVDTKMEDTEAELRKRFAPNLITYYLRILHVQLSRFEEPTGILLAAIEAVVSGSSGAIRNTDLLQLIEAEKVMAAVLLARTERSITWDGKPAYDPAREPAPSTAFASFAASAHLNAQRVERVMQVVLRSLADVRTTFEDMMAASKKAKKAEAEGTPVVGVKRERSP